MTEIYNSIKSQAANVEAFGGTIKFVVDGSPIYIDGSGDSNLVSQDDKDASCVIITDSTTFNKLHSGDLNPMMAVMSGKMKIKGDMGLAMKLQSIL